MVLGISRGRIREEQRDLHPRFDRAVPLHRWHAERGETLLATTVDLRGGFPGYAAHGASWQGAPLKVTTTHLIAGDGRPDGFALPLETIVGTALVRSAWRDDLELRVFYGADEVPRCFTIGTHGVRLAGWGARRAEELQQALTDAGVADVFADAPPELLDLAISDDAFRPFEDDNVMWSGRASAPSHPGSTLAPAKVWLTTRAIVWRVGGTLNRLPLSLVESMSLVGRNSAAGTMLVAFTAGSASTGLFTIPFVFDLESIADRNRMERGAFVVGLRSRGVAEREPLPSWQPWAEDAPQPDDWFADSAGRDMVVDQRPASVTEREIAQLRERAERALRGASDAIMRIAAGEPAGDLPAQLSGTEVARAQELGGPAAARLIAVNEIAVRLSTLIELHERRLITSDDLIARHEQLLSTLGAGVAAA